ncbi:MAG TPA: hypothetical protein PLQ76_04500, partial [bacterium]|nr:hypothetical protein [bacterium]
MANGHVESDREAPRTYGIEGMEIFRAGTWTDSEGRTICYGDGDIAGMAEAYGELAGRFEAPVKLGHDPEQPLLKTDGLPAAGWLKNLRAVGGCLIADIAGMPKRIYDLVRAGAYRKRSLEVLHDFKDEAGGKTHPHVAAGLALLGANLPAIGSLSDIAALYESTAGADAYFYSIDSSGAIDSVGSEAVEPVAGTAVAEAIGEIEERLEDIEERVEGIENSAAEVEETESGEAPPETTDNGPENGSVDDGALETEPIAGAVEEEAEDVRLA